MTQGKKANPDKVPVKGDDTGLPELVCMICDKLANPRKEQFYKYETFEICSAKECYEKVLQHIKTRKHQNSLRKIIPID